GSAAPRCRAGGPPPAPAARPGAASRLGTGPRPPDGGRPGAGPAAAPGKNPFRLASARTVGTSLCSRGEARPSPREILGRDLPAALLPAALGDAAPAGGRHPRAEADRLLAAPLVGLKGASRHRTGILASPEGAVNGCGCAFYGGR